MATEKENYEEKCGYDFICCASGRNGMFTGSECISGDGDSRNDIGTGNI